jgi:Integrase core domain
MMSLSSRRELLASVCVRYKQGDKSEKGRILDELVATCGYDRKYAISALRRAARSGAASGSPKPRTRRATYGDDVGLALLRLWKMSRGLCSCRLVALLPELMDALERHGEADMPDAVKDKLLRVSAATAGRMLGRLRRSHGYGVSTTSPATLLRHQIPLHTFSDWKEAKPGFMEIDLVAHCGDTAIGQFVYTLTATDVASGWTEYVAIPNRGQMAVIAGLETIIGRLPFELLGIDTDNGAEFINYTLKTFCEERSITFTRGRPYKKNDQCHVEQKNGAVIRPLVGYARYEGADATDYLNRLYAVHRLHLNYFCPSQKLTGKKRTGAKVQKTYDPPRTPYARLIEYAIWDKDQQEQMQERYRRINPAKLARRIEELEAGLKRVAAITTPDIDARRTPARKPALPAYLFSKKTK